MRVAHFVPVSQSFAPVTGKLILVSRRFIPAMCGSPNLFPYRSHLLRNGLAYSRISPVYSRNVRIAQFVPVLQSFAPVTVLANSRNTPVYSRNVRVAQFVPVSQSFAPVTASLSPYLTGLFPHSAIPVFHSFQKPIVARPSILHLKSCTRGRR